MRLRTSVISVLCLVLAAGLAAQAQEPAPAGCPDLKKTSDKLTLRFYWASWCGPCRQMIPLIDGVNSVVRVEKIDIDAPANTKAVAQAGVKGIPMIIFTQEGKTVGSKVGAIGQKGFCDWVARVTGQDAQEPAAPSDG